MVSCASLIYRDLESFSSIAIEKALNQIVIASTLKNLTASLVKKVTLHFFGIPFYKVEGNDPNKISFTHLDRCLYTKSEEVNSEGLPRVLLFKKLFSKNAKEIYQSVEQIHVGEDKIFVTKDPTTNSLTSIPNNKDHASSTSIEATLIKISAIVIKLQSEHESGEIFDSQFMFYINHQQGISAAEYNATKHYVFSKLPDIEKGLYKSKEDPKNETSEGSTV